MTLIKSELKNSETQRQTQLLKFASQNCSREFLSNYFQVSDYVVRRSRELFKYKGIFGEVGSKKGKLIYKESHIFISQKFINQKVHLIRNEFIEKILPEGTTNLVQSFYLDEEYSRQMPCKKDFFSIFSNVHMQKRLILCNLRELYITFINSDSNHKVSIMITYLSRIYYDRFIEKYN